MKKNEYAYILVQDTKNKEVITVHVMKGYEPEAYIMTTTLKSSNFMKGVYAVSEDVLVKFNHHYSSSFGNLYVMILGWPAVIGYAILKQLRRKK